MRCRTGVLLLSFAAAIRLPAQSPPVQQSSGVTSEWDVRAQMVAIAADVRKLQPLLGQANPAQWTEKGAPAAYVKQLQSAKDSVQSLINASNSLSEQPEKLPVALDAFFQMERMELLLNSLRDGIRKYQSGALADQLNRAFAANFVHRDRLRQHIRDLANLREEEFQIAHEEAQRCRGVLTKRTSPDRKSVRNQSR